MERYRIEIEVLADAEDAHDLYNAIYRVAFNDADAVVIAEISMTLAIPPDK